MELTKNERSEHVIGFDTITKGITEVILPPLQSPAKAGFLLTGKTGYRNIDKLLSLTNPKHHSLIQHIDPSKSPYTLS